MKICVKLVERWLLLMNTDIVGYCALYADRYAVKIICQFIVERKE